MGYYILKENDKLFGDKGRLISDDIYNVLPKESKEKFKFDPNNRRGKIDSIGIPEGLLGHTPVVSEATINQDVNVIWADDPFQSEEDLLDEDDELDF